MSDKRDQARREFVAAQGWPAEATVPMTADASTRRYFRLSATRRDDVILMDAPRAAESAACPPDADAQARARLGYNAMARLAGPDGRAFTGASAWLRAQGLSAPEVFAADYEAGFFLLEDLGDGLFASEIGCDADPAPLYEAAVEVLLHLHALTPSEMLNGFGGAQWPLLTYDTLALRAETDLFVEWYLPAARGRTPDDAAAAAFKASWGEALSALSPASPVFVHRDYHAENLIWLPERDGIARVGLLDFQDALRGAPAYDLVSLLSDARRDVEPWLAKAMLDLYVERRLEADRDFDGHGFQGDYALLTAQRTTKILGIFARLCYRDGKPRYLSMMPRLWGYMDACLDHPALGPVKAWFDAHVPEALRGDTLAKAHEKAGPAGKSP